MPDIVQLKRHTATSCGSEVAQCNQLGCFLQFQLQAYHPQDTYRNSVRGLDTHNQL